MALRGGLIKFFRQREQSPAIGINWICFDGGGHEEMPKSGYIIENYTRAHKDQNAGANREYKSVVQPARVKACNVHYCLCKRFQRTADENGLPLQRVWGAPSTKRNSTRLVRINHYFSKSKEEYLVKLNVRGDVNKSKRAFNENSWNYPEWKTDNVMQEAAAALRAKGVPETYSPAAGSGG